MALVTKLKEYRERDNFKQAELAELVGVRRETIVNLEKGKLRDNPSLKLEMDIARSFTPRWENFCVHRSIKTSGGFWGGRNRPLGFFFFLSFFHKFKNVNIFAFCKGMGNPPPTW